MKFKMFPLSHAAAPASAEQYWQLALKNTVKDSAAVMGMARDCSNFDRKIGRLEAIESRHHFIEQLAPHGSHQGDRKRLSYDGAVRKDRGIASRDTDKYWDPSAVYDPGNYCYGVVMRAWASTSSGWLQDCVQDEWNDETLGDILEAILGSAWQLRNGQIIADEKTKARFEQYTIAIEDAVIAGEIVIQHTVNMGIWVDSKTLNRYLNRYLRGSGRNDIHYEIVVDCNDIHYEIVVDCIHYEIVD